MPTTLGYFIYLVYVAITGLADVGYISLILIGAIYGVQAVIFILRREWQQIGWMFIYLLAYPLWSCILPIYSFWHMDDFSWGNTRVVVGDGKRKLIIEDDKPFDPASIPQRRWAEYEAALAGAGVLNAPPPNMNPLADSSREDDRGTMFSRVSGAAGSRYGAHTPGPVARAGTPTTIISASGSVTDPRLQLSMPVAQQAAVSPPSMPVGYGAGSGYGMPQQSQQQRESVFSSSSYGVPSMYVPQALLGGGMPGLMMSGAMPTDEQLVESIRRILRSHDLNTVTKKSVRAQLAGEYGMDLSARKEFIGDAIQLILAGQL
ncbi:hypothetical protein H4R26_003391 [Coemansia thaxteri]|uniref:DEK-C domain-containing protein n=1 Tax=Coemansia thaxteri TaxID=2663907 RepID=A0A9W8EHN7_9FUNG|nr:hypothetical protein H4R26_003391 [Coemansia thaxteri]